MSENYRGVFAAQTFSGAIFLHLSPGEIDLAKLAVSALISAAVQIIFKLIDKKFKK